MDPRMFAFECYEHGLVLKQVQMFDAALEDFRQAATHPHYTGKAQVQVALCLKAMGRYEEAVTAFYRGLESPTFSSKERVHILYLLGQTLESLGRYAEPLEIYGWIRQEDPGFLDVEHRIEYLNAGGRDRVPQQQRDIPSWVDEMLKLERQFRPQILSLLDQSWEWLRRYGKPSRWIRRARSSVRGTAHKIPHRLHTPEQRSLPAAGDRKLDKRQHRRVVVHLASRFSSKERTVAGEGEVRDLSPGGCRVTSPITVPVGAELECYIFPQDAGNPLTVEGATVRWSHSWEFGLAFTKVQPEVQRQIAQLCGTPL
jgi:tetratricopeptide (TPR) repeat protein